MIASKLKAEPNRGPRRAFFARWGATARLLPGERERARSNRPSALAVPLVASASPPRATIPSFAGASFPQLWKKLWKNLVISAVSA